MSEIIIDDEFKSQLHHFDEAIAKISEELFLGLRRSNSFDNAVKLKMTLRAYINVLEDFSNQI